MQSSQVQNEYPSVSLKRHFQTDVDFWETDPPEYAPA